MTLTRKLIIAFWIFIIAMGIWEFYNYNQGLSEQARVNPTQKQFFFLPPSTKPDAPATHAHASGADVVQTDFKVEENAPTPGNYTCHVTLKNEGDAKAVGIQIMVRPYRGVSNYDEDAGNQHPVYLDDDNPISRIGSYVSFPDLDPGQSATEDISFIDRADFQPGKNPNPTILFQTDKSTAPAHKTIPSVPGGGG